jgi:archaellum component FlaF (FlaF/FlaG flagellin family)
MPRHKKTKRGLSTVVTGAILLSAVSIMGIMVVGWANTNLTTHQIDLEETFSDHYNKINEKMLIEHVWFGNTGPSINITMNNIGTIGLNVTTIKITNITSSQEYSYTYTDSGIFTGNTLSINQTFGWTTDIPYEILITTGRDTQFRTEVLSP